MLEEYDMKKIIAICLAFCMVLGLAACGESAPKLDPASNEGQLKTIADSKDVWYNSDAMHLYAVTDLDENGRLEMIASQVEGSGQFSSNHFYEVSEDFTSLQPVEYTYGMEHSEPDLGGLTRLRCYRIPGDNVYIVNDVIRLNADEVYDVQDYICLKNGSVNVEDLAWCMMLGPGYTGDSFGRTQVYYYEGGDNGGNIDVGTYINYCDSFFEPYERLVCTLGWTEVGADEKDDALLKTVTDSWNGFKLEADDLVFDNLKYDPASYLPSDQKIVVGDEPVYNVEDLDGNWKLFLMEDEGGNMVLADLLGADSGLTFFDKSRLVYFNYGKPGDPRSGMLLTDMSYAVGDGRGLDEDPNGWYVEFSEFEGRERFQASIIPDSGLLLLTWFSWPEDNPGGDPTVTILVYAKEEGKG